MLQLLAGGFGTVALSALLADSAFSGVAPHAASSTTPLDPNLPHFAPRARSVIFLYMDGGPSQVDTFDPKPRLARENGQPFGMKKERTQFEDNGNTLQPPCKFNRSGECGLDVSYLFPHVARHADRLCVIRSMTSEFSEHTNANYFLHTGLGLAGRPSMGAWTTFGLGSANQNLPGFVVLNGGLIPPGGLECFGSGFLPASHQGSIFRAGERPVANIRPRESEGAQQDRKLGLIAALDRAAMAETGADDAIESAIRNHELAYRMQMAVPELMEIDREPADLREAYGLESKFEPTQIFGRQCLVARRLVERGVRFIELTCPAVSGDRWDQHSNLRVGHENNARAVDQPIGALLGDLASRGLLDETLVVWAGEFGRTPFAQGNNGRDHNPFGYSIWLAGGGTAGGTVFGATDEYGYKVVDKKVQIHDLHATMLHLLGVDHTQLTFPFGGRDMRLTDVHGHVIDDWIA
ncbi:MAG: DUF1501 domain-containing protein [Planctomycetota bacterium]